MPAKTDTVARHKPASRRKPASRGIASSRKKKQAVSRTMPVWVRNLLAFCIFRRILLVLYPSLRLSLETLLRAERLWSMYALQLRSAWH